MAIKSIFICLNQHFPQNNTLVDLHREINMSLNINF